MWAELRDKLLAGFGGLLVVVGIGLIVLFSIILDTWSDRFKAYGIGVTMIAIGGSMAARSGKSFQEIVEVLLLGWF